MRKKIIAGNWKMNMLPSEAEVFIKKIFLKINNNENEVLIFPPAIDLFVLSNALKNSSVKYGVQNFYFEDKGAYTGEISLGMVSDLGATHVLIGHSERRQIFKEDNEMIHKKIVKAVEKNFVAVVCVGEELSKRESGEMFEFIKSQVDSAFDGLDAETMKNIVIAYEPIWAIGTGKTATSDEAEEVCSYIRKLICDKFGNNISDNMRILYGGSVNGKNAKELFMKPNIDGGLIGGASLTEEFVDIINYLK